MSTFQICNANLQKATVAYVKDIAHIYKIFHCNQFIIPSKVTAWDTSCLTINDFAVQGEMVAMEDFVDVGQCPLHIKAMIAFWRCFIQL